MASGNISKTIDLKDLKINKVNFPEADCFSKFGTIAPKEVTDYFANAVMFSNLCNLQK